MKRTLLVTAFALITGFSSYQIAAPVSASQLPNNCCSIQTPCSNPNNNPDLRCVTKNDKRCSISDGGYCEIVKTSTHEPVAGDQ